MLRRVTHISLGVLTLFVLSGFIIIEVSPEFGGKPEMESMNRIKKTVNFRNGKFQNLTETRVMANGFFKSIKAFMFSKNKESVPKKNLP